MENLHRIIKAVDFIEKNIKEDISVKEVAFEVYFSNFYFHKLFQLFVGESPGQYIKKRRLYEAAMLLKQSNVKVIDAALEYGYESPEAFSRAFKRHLGITPKEIKQNPDFLIRYAKKRLTLNDLAHIQGVISMEPKIIEKDEIKIIGPIYYGDNKNDEIPKFWEKHFGKISSLVTKKGDGCFGFCFHSEEYIEKGFFHYMPSVEVESFKIIPLNAVGKVIPKHKYAVFTHKGSAENLGDTYKYIHGIWFPNKKYILNKGFDFEYYTTDKDGNDIIEIYIPIIENI